MNIDPKLVRSAYIGKRLKDIIEEKNNNLSNDEKITLTLIAKKLKTYHPAISSILNGKKSGADKFFTKIGKAIGLTDRQIKEIFKEADREEYKYKYGEDILSSQEFSYEELFNIMKEKENLSESQIKAIQDFIEFQKRQN